MTLDQTDRFSQALYKTGVLILLSATLLFALEGTADPTQFRDLVLPIEIAIDLVIISVLIDVFRPFQPELAQLKGHVKGFWKEVR